MKDHTRQLNLGLAVMLLAMMTSMAGAAITSNGGTEDFESLGMTDETEITSVSLATWTVKNLATNAGFYYDTSSGGGILDTATSPTNALAGTKPASSADLKFVVNAVEALSDHIVLTLPQVTGRSFKYTYWINVGVVNATDTEIGVCFPGISPNPQDAYLCFGFKKDTKDIKARVRPTVSASGNKEDQYIGIDDTDNDDYVLKEWNKFEIEFVTSDDTQGNVVFRFNGAQVGTSVAIKQDPGTTMLNHKFYVFHWKNAKVSQFYIDDINISPGPSSVDEWRLYN